MTDSRDSHLKQTLSRHLILHGVPQIHLPNLIAHLYLRE